MCVCVCVCVCVAKQRLYKVPRLADPQEVLQQHYDVADVQHAALGLQAMADKGGERDLALSSGAAVMVAVDVLIHQQVKHQRAHKVQQQAAVLGQTCRRYVEALRFFPPSQLLTGRCYGADISTVLLLLRCSF